jgi:hypothetical protein
MIAFILIAALIALGVNGTCPPASLAVPKVIGGIQTRPVLESGLVGGLTSTNVRRNPRYWPGIEPGIADSTVKEKLDITRAL